MPEFSVRDLATQAIALDPAIHCVILNTGLADQLCRRFKTCFFYNSCKYVLSPRTAWCTPVRTTHIVAVCRQGSEIPTETTYIELVDTVQYVAPETVFVVDFGKLAVNPELIEPVRAQLEASLKTVATYKTDELAGQFEEMAKKMRNR